MEVDDAGSAVKDLRMGMGLGEITGGGVEELPAPRCQRSSTELCFFPDGVKDRSGVGELSGEPTSSDALFSTTFFTKPRPCNRLRLGVGCFSGGGLRKAGEGFCEGGIWGLPNVGRGTG